MANVFHFKRFSIYQDRCAFKVGTDGILLGSWAENDTPSRILDIGTGTGLIALMLAQRFPQAVVDGVEVDSQSAAQAAENVNQSPWANRVNITNQTIQAFSEQSQTRYDLIVSNPPFFASENNLLAAGRREGTRQTTQLSYIDLLQSIERLLGKNGRFCTILPISISDSFQVLAADAGLYCVRETAVKPVPHKSPHRHLLQFERTQKPVQKDSLTIETVQRHLYSPEFTELTKNFYLKF